MSVIAGTCMFPQLKLQDSLHGKEEIDTYALKLAVAGNFISRQRLGPHYCCATKIY